MPRKKKPKFKVGDRVIEESGRKGIIIDEEQEDQEDILIERKLLDLITKENTYGIKWFEEKEGSSSRRESQLTICEGVKNRDLCEECKYRFLCFTS